MLVREARRARRRRRAPGTASGFETTTSSPDVAAIAAVDVRGERERPRVLEHAGAGRARSPTLPGRFAITTSSSTCGASAGSERSSSRGVPVRDDDGGDRSPSERLPVDLERALARSRATRTAARARARPRRAARGRRRARRIPSASSRSSAQTAASPATSRSAALGHGDDRRPARHRLEHRQAEALVARRLHEAGGAAVEGGRARPRLDVAARRARRAARARGASAASFAGPATTSGSPAASAAASAASWFFRSWTAPTTRT